MAPAHQGRGLGRRVAAPGIAAATEAGLGVQLETTNPRNPPFYRSLGFEETSQFTLGPDGPAAWSMWRPLSR